MKNDAETHPFRQDNTQADVTKTTPSILALQRPKPACFTRVIFVTLY
jgi:hypothetical protein